ncbi:MAG: phage major capsid protein [Pseudomonadota bacterium]
MPDDEADLLRRVGAITRVRMVEDGDDGGTDDRRVVVSFSSEHPAQIILPPRAAGADPQRMAEVLSHEPGAMSLAAIDSGRAPVLLDHRNSVANMVGHVVAGSVRIENGRGHAVLEFHQSPQGREQLRAIRAGEPIGISVGYTIQRAKRDGRVGDLPRLLVTGWTPREVSLVPIPEDPAVGIGRSVRSLAPVQIEEAGMPKDNASTTPDDKGGTTPAGTPESRERSAGGAGATPAEVTPAGPSNAEMLAAERNRSASIRAIGRQFKLPDDMVERAERDGTPVDRFNKQVLDHLASEEQTGVRTRAAEIGLTDKEKREFSLSRAIRSMIDPSNQALREAAAFEFECSAAAEKHYGRSAQGLMLPEDVMGHGWNGVSRERAQVPAVGTEAIFSPSNAITPVDHRPDMFINMLRNRSALTRAGITVLAGLQGDLLLPRQTSGGSLEFVGETGTASDNPQPVIHDLVALRPRTARMQYVWSRKMAIQSSPDVEMLLRRDLALEMALGLDKAGLYGATNGPTGMATGVNAVKLTDFAGATPTFEEVVGLETAVATANADMGNLSYLMAAGVRGALKTTRIDAGSGIMVMGSDGQLNGYGHVCSNQVNAGELWFGNWSDVLMGVWSGLDILVNPYQYNGSGILITAHQDVDFAIRHKQSVAWAEPTA